MTDVLAQAAVWLSAIANTLGWYLLAPVGFLPGWLSATVVSGATGVLSLAVFKFASDQGAIKRVRDDINAHLLVLKLFKDSAWVSLRAQGRILAGAFRLFVLAVVPMLAMTVPVTLLLGQLALWYQARPLRVGEDAVVTLKLNGDASSDWPAVNLRPTQAVEVTLGPVRVRSQREVCWNIKPRQSGGHSLVFQVDDQVDTKEIAVGEGLMRVSQARPGWDWSSILLNPWEQPFRPHNPVRSIVIAYPRRSSWTSGTDSWMIYWLVVSMAVALCFRGALKVHV